MFNLNNFTKKEKESTLLGATGRQKKGLMPLTGFTLLELIIVAVIIGIIVAIGLPSFSKVKERSLNKEAIAQLKLIQAAQKIYNMEIGVYYGSSDIGNINQNLKVSLPTGTNRNWSYTTDTAGGSTATRNGYGGRIWSLTISGEPTCSGTDCP